MVSKLGSIIYTLSKVIPLRFTTAVGKKIGTKIATKVGTNVIGRFLGRLVPYASLAITIYDVNDYLINKTYEMTPVDQRENLLMALGTAF